MTDTTLGQRIAERRKLLALSQEAFGDKMGVSRQAISKWEADAATPEIEKLIAMSKLFDVSVGWLLGTEEDPSPKAESFSEAQIRAIEQIAHQYRSEPTPQSRRSWHTIACVIGVVLSLILSITALVKLEETAQNSAYQTSYINNSIANLQHQISALRNPPEVESTGAELLMDWQIGIEAKADLSGAYITFTGVPINTQTDDQAYISIRRDGQEVTTALCSRDGSGYTATVELPIADNYACYFMVVHADGTSEQQRLVYEELAHLDYALRPHAYCSMADYSYSAEKKKLQVQFTEDSYGELGLCSPAYLPADAQIQWADLKLVLYRNETAVDRLALSDFRVSQDASGVLEISPPDSYHFSLPNFQNGDKALLYLEGKLTINGETSNFSTFAIGWYMDAEYGLCFADFSDKD